MAAPTSRSRRNFIKYGIAGAVGFGVASAIEIPILNNTIQNDNSDISQKNAQISQLQSQIPTVTSLQEQITGSQALKILSINETNELEAIVEAIIPADENGLGAKEAGVIYFIDHQLYGEYGNNARMYKKGPFVLSGQSGSITVEGVTYSGGTMSVPYPGPTYQYNLLLREFWRRGLDALQSYSNSAYGNNFEKLSSVQQIQALTDLYNNKPTAFNDIIPRDFFNELIFMTWSGFFMDPTYGGNQQMAGWKLTGFNGTNMGNDYGEGHQSTDLMVSSKPVRLQPSSLGHFQKNGGLI